jgi:tRNA threonylcarbamoyladenosine biosynthesis protein TsaE
MIMQSPLFLPDEASLMAFGIRLAKATLVPAIFFMHGPLGAGKTTLTRGFLRGLGYEDRVKSPTYTLVESYELDSINVFHFDLYRVHDPHELEFMGVQDYFKYNAICLIEWPEKGEGLLPSPDISFYLEMHSAGRKIKWVAASEHGKTILQRLAHD